MGVERTGPLVAVTVALVVSAGLAGCTGSESNTAGPSMRPDPGTATSETGPEGTPASTTPAPTTPARTKKWIELQVGDCLAGLPSADPAVVTVNVVDCATPHLAEVYLRANIPVNAVLTGTADEQCGAGLMQYTGLAVNASPYTITYLIDSEQDRTSNNPYPSTVICLLAGAQGQSFTESARR
ncbi:MAG: hypothetical protein WD228_01025 [Mycobacterium sp.]